jgi:DNA-binding transcriptional MerR regulator
VNCCDGQKPTALTITLGGGELAEYRLEELANVSGVNVRNIRAYRERGLLDPPRRQGRASFYDEHHVGQLKTIGDLLHRGFSSAHVAEFFTCVRQGHDLADLLGLHEAILGRRRDVTPVPVDVDPGSPEARRACVSGLAHVVDGHLTFVNSDIAAIVAGADDPLDYIRALLRVHDAVGSELEAVGAVRAQALEESIEAHYGAHFVPRSEDMSELLRRVADYRALADHVIADLLDAVVERRLVAAVSAYTAARLSRRHWEPEAP